jgi:hypothetical protein
VERTPSANDRDELVSALLQLRRESSWTLRDTTTVHHDVGHPQGITPWADQWLVTTVRTDRAVGEVFVVDGRGDLVARREVVDGDRFHPGGVSADDDGVWVALAEYRPRSSTRVLRLDRSLEVIDSFVVDDHLGAICPLSDGSLFAVSWAARRWYRLTDSGAVVADRRGANRFVDAQDLTVLADGLVAATGVGQVTTPTGTLQLGGVSVIDPDALASVHDAPIGAWMPSGRSATHNATHLAVDGDGGAVLHCLVDDVDAAIGHWVVDVAGS